ncbi:MAG: polysaccharide export protein, partial [Duncaniella sp.]|nr:polysaccharide export protein [Duncaniella sp.]
TEASDMIRQRIIDGNYIKDPIVTMEFKNFHYTVLGAANGNGTHTCDGDRITILEAIAQAGDLASNADLGKIAVIREEGNTRKVYTVDIRKSDIFNSPAFYLAQNDIIYVRPKKPKSEEKTNFLQWLTVALSIVTATTSVIWVTK